MSDENKQNQTPQQLEVPKEPPKVEPKPVEFPKPNDGEIVTKGG